MHNAIPESSGQADLAIPGNIFLVGMMGAGKTSVGRVLAKRLSKVFYDSDHVIEGRTGVKIPVIFEIEGESGFRHRESAVLDELTALDEVVLATGGGAVLVQENRDRLRARGTVVYLRASVKDLLNRTRYDKNRPLLQTADPRTRINELYEMRDPLYREVAHLTIDTGNQSLTTLVNRLHQVLETRCDQPAAAQDQPRCEP
ncbi:MAG: shikimate kinase AroK [Betaproteobacteria bacterium]|nr:shikimate kinase AroK [Betaproteobacteria bacterium]